MLTYMYKIIAKHLLDFMRNKNTTIFAIKRATIISCLLKTCIADKTKDTRRV